MRNLRCFMAHAESNVYSYKKCKELVELGTIIFGFSCFCCAGMPYKKCTSRILRLRRTCPFAVTQRRSDRAFSFQYYYFIVTCPIGISKPKRRKRNSCRPRAKTPTTMIRLLIPFAGLALKQTSSSIVEPRIVGGITAEAGEFPFLAVGTSSKLCGGSLIWPDVCTEIDLLEMYL